MDPAPLLCSAVWCDVDDFVIVGSGVGVRVVVVRTYSAAEIHALRSFLTVRHAALVHLVHGHLALSSQDLPDGGTRDKFEK